MAAAKKKATRSTGAPAPRLSTIRDDLRKKGVKYCFSSYVDVHGVAKGKTVPIEHFERMMRGSELFTGAAIDGLGQGPHDDELAVYPDPAAVTQLPWEPEVAWCPGNLKYHEEPWPMCSRTILQQQVARAAKLGFTFNLGIECEVYIVRREGNGIVPNQDRDNLAKAAYDFAGTLLNYRYLDEIVSAMNALGWDVHSFDHEDANGQFEFDFAYADALTMADRFVLWRLMMKEITRRYGWEATCMPKPYSDRTGSGAHFNMSLADLKTGKNLCGDARDARGCGLSRLSYQFLGGVRKHAAAIVATTCPTVNSYKRLIKTGSMTGFTWAPVFVSYGGNNRTHMLRVPKLRPHIEGTGEGHGPYLSAARLECRAVDPAMNPLPRSRYDACRGPRRHRERSRPRGSDRREHVPAERRAAPAQGSQAAATHPAGGGRSVLGRPARQAGDGKGAVRRFRRAEDPGMVGLPQPSLAVGDRPVPDQVLRTDTPATPRR